MEPFVSSRCIFPSVLALLSFLALAFVLTAKASSSSSWLQNDRLFHDPNDVPPSIMAKLDAVFVLGGGAPESLNKPPVYVQRRCDDAATIVEKYGQLPSQGRFLPWVARRTPDTKRTFSTTSDNNLHWSESTIRNASQDRKLPILCLSAGTAHVPQLVGSNGLPIWESTSCAAYLKEHHHLHDHVYVETTSFDTIGNAFYARTTHTAMNGWRHLLVITNEFHMDRTMAIFDWIFLQVKDPPKTARYHLYYLASPNVGLSPEAIQARQEKETASMNTVRTILAPRYKTMAEVYQFLTQEHSMYTASKLVERARGQDEAGGVASEMIKKSYGGT